MACSSVTGVGFLPSNTRRSFRAARASSSASSVSPSKRSVSSSWLFMYSTSFMGIYEADARTHLSHGLCMECCEVEEEGPSNEVKETEV